MLGTPELIMIGIVAVVLLFGAAKVPQLARSFGQAMGEYKKAKREADLDLKKLEDTVVGEEEVPRPKSKVAEKKKTDEVKIREVARYMGIETEGKTDEELKEEVEAKLEAASK